MNGKLVLRFKDTGTKAYSEVSNLFSFGEQSEMFAEGIVHT